MSFVLFLGVMKKRRASVIIIRDNKVILIQRIKSGTEYYVLPGGGIESGESPEQAAIREAKEELSIDIVIDRLLLVDTNFMGGGENYFFLASSSDEEVVLGGEERAAMNEQNQYHLIWENINELPNNLKPAFLTSQLLLSFLSQ